MTILVCNVDEEGRFGGPERRIVQVSNALKAYEVETHVVYPKIDSELFESELQKYKIDSTQLDITRLSKQKKFVFRYLLRFPTEVLLLRKFFSENKFHIIHVNGAYQYKAAIAGRSLGLPIVWHLNDTHLAGIVKLIFSFFAKILASGFIVAGNRVYDYYLANLNIKDDLVEEIHAPVNFNDFNPNKYNNKNYIDSKEICIGTVSSIIPVKGVEYFVEVAARLMETFTNLNFSIAGQSLSSQKEYQNIIENRIIQLGIENKIVMLGFVADVPYYLSKLDIFVCTSVSEASPTSVWEALAMGKPVVTTDVGSVSQYISNGDSGFIVPVGDVDELVEKITCLIKESILRKKFSDYAINLAQETLGVKSAAMKHKNIYSKILNSHK